MTARSAARGTCLLSSSHSECSCTRCHAHRYFQADPDHGIFVKKSSLCRELRIAGHAPSDVVKQLAAQLSNVERDQGAAAKQTRALENQVRSQLSTIAQLQHSLEGARTQSREAALTIDQLAQQLEAANILTAQARACVDMIGRLLDEF
jgi:septal ring factor EnvC (AmiA/AmiB activator)